jgi:colanic acid/amylovoran biosynthesis protein
MLIEIKGVQFYNKGAELMLLTIMEHLSQRYSQAKFASELYGASQIADYERRGIYVRLNKVIKGRIDTGDLGRFLPKSYRENHNIIREKDVDVIIDSSGFAYGDYWGAKKAALRLGNNIKRWKREGKKVILMPQAFGSFQDQRLGKVMISIIDSADLVFARDQYSYEYLINLLGGLRQNIKVAPDFTNLVKGTIPENFDHKTHQVAIIPNKKMLTSQAFERNEDYFLFLKKVITQTINKGLKPYFLLHEGQQDMSVIKEVEKLLDISIPVIENNDPVKLKGILKTAFVVIGSRFHGLVGALSQGVPTLCVGWSHKYEALFEDYEFKMGLMNPKSLSDQILENKLNVFFDKKENDQMRTRLVLRSEVLKEKSRETWNEVFNVIDNSNRK